MRTNPRHQDHIYLVIDFGLDPILVSLDVEDGSVFAQEANTRVSGFDVCGATPLRSLHLANPGLHGGADIGVPTDKVIELGLPE